MFNNREIFGLRKMPTLENKNFLFYLKKAKEAVKQNFGLGFITGAIFTLLLFAFDSKALTLEEQLVKTAHPKLTLDAQKKATARMLLLNELKTSKELKKAQALKPELARYRTLKRLKKVNARVLVSRGFTIANGVLIAISVYCSFYECKKIEESEEDQ